MQLIPDRNDFTDPYQIPERVICVCGRCHHGIVAGDRYMEDEQGDVICEDCGQAYVKGLWITAGEEDWR